MTVYRSHVRFLAVVATATGLACGGNDKPKLTTEEQQQIAKFNLAFASTALNSSRFGQTLRGVDFLIDLVREKPTATYDGLTVREVVQDAANTLDPYRPELVRELDRALDD